MKKLILTRTHILNNCMKGFLSIEGSKFSCYTLEAACPYGKYPMNRTYHYALDCGTYKVILKPYRFYPLFPQIICKPYKNISFCEQQAGVPKAGNIAIGSKFVSEHFLMGFDDVAQALLNMIYTEFSQWKEGVELVIQDDPDLQTVCDGYDEEDDTSNYNFADL